MATAPEGIEDKIEKLLRMADGTANENESAVALQMAQKLADAYNLDLGNITRQGARKDEELSVGLYKYQRTLYEEMGRLNHCKVWITKGLTKGSKYKTRLLGSKVNVAFTTRAAEYVEQVVNRHVNDQFDKRDYFSKAAHEYRHGMVDRLVERIKARRVEEEADRQREKREQEARMRHPGASTENAIVLISDVQEREEEANYDYLNGEGAWARRKAYAAEQERLYEERRKTALANAEQWERDHPEEAARQKIEQEKERQKQLNYWARLDRAAERRRQERIDRHGYDPKDYRPSKPDVTDSPHYWAGQRTAETVNLDDQITKQHKAQIK